MSESITVTPIINFTDAAAVKVYSLVVEEQNPKLNLRAFITGGGCSGFQYGFTFDEAVNDDDTVIVKQVVAETETETETETEAEAEAEADADDSDGGESGSGTVTVKLVVDALSLQYLKGADIDYREDIEGARFVIRNPNAKTTCGCGSSFAA